jgi:DNA-binding CsgD family transcriptional regulator/tetratricopeptide (TPR) repeat protein
VRSTTDPDRPLQDRHAERAALQALISGAREGTSAALVVRGEPGVGKTALLDDVLAHAAGCRVVRASGVESEMELAFAGLHQLCAPFLERIDHLPAPQRSALRTAFGLEVGDRPDRFLVGLAVLNLLSEIAEAQPLVCLLDDAHWLDQASAQVLGFVARRLGSESVVMIFAIRQPWDDRHLAGLPELPVGPLPDEDARSLLASTMPGRLDDAVRDRIIAEAHGNALALLEIPRAWTPAALAGGFGLPDGVTVGGRIEESFRRRLVPLPVDSRAILLVAAADPTGDPGLILDAAGRLGIRREASESAIVAGLLDTGADLRFRHPLVRTVVYREAPDDERRRVHAALAASTDATHDPDRRAWHLGTAAAGPDEDVASELERSAGRAQARGGPAAAAAFLTRSVELTEDAPRRVDRALAAAQACFLAGAFDEVEPLLAVAEAATLDGFERGQAALLRGQLAVVHGYGNDAAPLLLAAATRLEPFDRSLARGAYLSAYSSAFAAAHLAEPGIFLDICRAAQRFTARSETSDPLDLLLEGLTRTHTDGRAIAIPILVRAAERLIELPTDEVVRWGWIAPMASNTIWDDAAATAIYKRQTRIIRESGALADLPVILSAEALDKIWSGDFDGANALIEESGHVAAATGSRLPPFAALRLLSSQGREAEASALIEGTIAMAETVGAGLAIRVAQWAAAVLYNGLGRYDVALASARQVTARDIDPYPTMWALPELVEAAARSGDRPAAEQALDRLAEVTIPAGTDFALGIEARSRALVSEAAEAETLYRDAIERLGRTKLRPELARAHLVYGEWLRRDGRRLDAREQLRAAHGMFVEIGMEAFAERARRELLATGEKVRKRTVETRDELTPQELQIARLVSEGRTNPEIAAELFLSRRTVEWHLRKVFDKLEIHSRRELPAGLRRTRV